MKRIQRACCGTVAFGRDSSGPKTDVQGPPSKSSQ
jgi:hypothetical protein